MSTPISTILCGTDGSPDAQAAVRTTAQLAHQLHAEVLLVHAVNLLEHLPVDASAPDHTVGDWATDQLNTTWSEPLRDGDIEHRCIAEEGPPLLAIPRIAERFDVDLIVVASHGRGQSLAVPLGSTAHGMVQVSRRPVLVVPGDSEEACHSA